MTESELQVKVAEYLVENYPDVLFHSDFGSGIKMTKGQAIKQKRQNGGRRGWPDMFIAEPKTETDSFEPIGMKAYGLFIELKKDGEKLSPGKRAKNRFKSIDGKEYKTEHLMEQADVLFKLRKAGYAAEFAVGFDETKRIIDEYLGGGSGHKN